MATFGPKPMLTPLEKCQFFDFLNFLFLQPRKTKLLKWPFRDQDHGLTPLEKCQFLDFFNFVFLQPRKPFFRSRIWQKIFSWPILNLKKSWKIGHFWTKPWVNPFGKISIFRLFQLLVSIASKGIFSFQNIAKDICLAYIA